MRTARQQADWNHVLYGLFAIAILGLSWFGGLFVERLTLSNIKTTAAERTLLYKSTLNNAITRLRYLPLVISRHPVISDLLEKNRGLDDARTYLSSINTASNGAVIFVLDKTGRTIASSNWQQAKSFEGNNYGFRPYFQHALAGREGRLFAIGVTTKRAGYFFSRPVYARHATNSVLGVVVVKVELNQLQSEWEEGGENVFVTSGDDVIILSSKPDWTYKTTKPLSLKTREKIAASRIFDEQNLDPLDFEGSQHRFQGTVSISGVQYHAYASEPDQNGLTVYYLAELGTAINAKWLSMILLLTVGILSLMIFLYLRERTRKLVLDKEAREARHIRRINEQLEAEVHTRKQVESELRNAQKELVLATKMAALGRMSAAIAHEVNQPIAAIATFAASSKLLLERGNNTDAVHALDDISKMTERLAIITGDLKLLARNSNEQHSRVDLRLAIANSLKLFEPEIESSDVTIKKQISKDPVWVEGSMTRIEQVLINLVRNALDALDCMSKSVRKRQISVSLFVENKQAVLRIEDNGVGLSSEVAEYLFDPFFTTKPLGEGTGLGLAISYGIVEEMGGKLRARNLPNGGASFSVRLDLAQKPLEQKTLEIAT